MVIASCMAACWLPVSVLHPHKAGQSSGCSLSDLNGVTIYMRDAFCEPCACLYCRVLLPQLAEWLCANHKTDERARRVVKDMHLHILVTMNPDGFAATKRENG